VKPLNLFYEEPQRDRWLPLDRYPRQIVRRIIRGQPKIGGQRRVFLNLCSGLDRLGIPFRANQFRRLRQSPAELACVIGKPCVLDKMSSDNPILFGASGYSHPIDAPDLFTRLPVKLVLVPGEWVRRMFEPYYGDRVRVWPTGIETDLWTPAPQDGKDIDVLLYDKVRWKHDDFQQSLIDPIRQSLVHKKLTIASLRYGSYEEADFHRLLERSRWMVFLCEHESQGIACQQALSANVPVLAWDRGGDWRDPEYYPQRARFSPVTSVPYWDERCGETFRDMSDFDASLELFLDKLRGGRYSPREYILENLTLERCARDYVKYAQEAEQL
jgi:hypothetical protein